MRQAGQEVSVPKCVPGSGRSVGAGDLQDVLAGFFRRHAELVLGGPGLDPRHGGARTEAVVHGLAVEGDCRPRRGGSGADAP